MLDLSLQGKRAVVTGASLGIGEAVVKMLSDHGASVTFCARNKDAIKKNRLIRKSTLETKITKTDFGIN